MSCATKSDPNDVNATQRPSALTDGLDVADVITPRSGARVSRHDRADELGLLRSDCVSPEARLARLVAVGSQVTQEDIGHAVGVSCPRGSGRTR